MQQRHAIGALIVGSALLLAGCQSAPAPRVDGLAPKVTLVPIPKAKSQSAVEPYSPPVVVHHLMVTKPSAGQAPALDRVCTLQGRVPWQLNSAIDRLEPSLSIKAMLVCPEETSPGRLARLWVQVPPERIEPLVKAITSHPNLDCQMVGFGGPGRADAPQILLQQTDGKWTGVWYPLGTNCYPFDDIAAAIKTAIDGVPAIRPAPPLGTTSISEYPKALNVPAGIVGTSVTPPNIYNPCDRELVYTSPSPVRSGSSTTTSTAVVMCPGGGTTFMLSIRHWIEVEPQAAANLLDWVASRQVEVPQPAPVCLGGEVRAPRVLMHNSDGEWINVMLPGIDCGIPSRDTANHLAAAIEGRPDITPPAFPPPPAKPYNPATSRVVTADNLTFVVPRPWRDFPQYAWFGEFGGYATFVANQDLSDPCTTRGAMAQSCGQPRTPLKPGGVIINFGYWGGPRNLPNPLEGLVGRWTQFAGRQAVITDDNIQDWCKASGGTHETSVSIANVPAGRVVTVDACMRAPSKTTHEQVMAMLRTLHF